MSERVHPEPWSAADWVNGLGLALWSKTISVAKRFFHFSQTAVKELVSDKFVLRRFVLLPVIGNLFPPVLNATKHSTPTCFDMSHFLIGRSCADGRLQSKFARSPFPALLLLWTRARASVTRPFWPEPAWMFLAGRNFSQLNLIVALARRN